MYTSMELRPEDVSLLERCPHFRRCYVHTSGADPGGVRWVRTNPPLRF